MTGAAGRGIGRYRPERYVPRLGVSNRPVGLVVLRRATGAAAVAPAVAPFAATRPEITVAPPTAAAADDSAAAEPCTPAAVDAGGEGIKLCIPIKTCDDVE